jgi:SAM-dependent methyltransferase
MKLLKYNKREENLLEINEIANIYTSQLLRGQLLCVPDYDQQWQYIKDYLPQDHRSFILDAGCGEGRYMRKVSSQGYKNVYGFDLFDFHPQHDRYTKASVARIPFKDSVFDLVFSQGVIFYLPNPETALREFLRVLKPNGILIITAHTKYSLFTLDRVVKRFLNLKCVSHLNGVKFYTSMQYKYMYDKVGFNIVEIDGYKLSYLFMPMLRRVYKVLGLKDARFPWTITRILGQKNSLLNYMKSIICYFSVIVGRKPI